MTKPLSLLHGSDLECSGRKLIFTFGFGHELNGENTGMQVPRYSVMTAQYVAVYLTKCSHVAHLSCSSVNNYTLSLTSTSSLTP